MAYDIERAIEAHFARKKRVFKDRLATNSLPPYAHGLNGEVQLHPLFSSVDAARARARTIRAGEIEIIDLRTGEVVSVVTRAEASL